MRKQLLGTCMWSGLVSAVMTVSAGAAFTPLFEVTDVKGVAVAEVAATGETRTLQGNEGFAYGTLLRTAADASLTIVLDPDNRIVVGPDATVRVHEAPADPSRKILRLHKGKLDLALAREFQKENGVQIVTHCLVLNVLAGGAASVESGREAELHVVTIVSRGAQLDLAGNDFTVPLLKEPDALSVACTDDQSFVRLRNIEGRFSVQVKDGAHQIRLAEMIKDSVIKILRKGSDADASLVLVTLLEVGPDGNVIVADTYEVPVGEGPELLPPDEDIEPTVSQPGLDGETFPTTTSSTSTSTTTTTVPPGDLVTLPPPTIAKPVPPPPATTKPDATPRGRR